MNRDELSDWLDSAWETVCQSAYDEPDPEVDHFVNHRLTSIRYAVITQLLAKIVNPVRDILRLTSEGTSEDTAPRTLASAVVVPWSQTNDNVLGGSADPYVNNPLRRDSLLSDESTIRTSDRAEWARLAEYLDHWNQTDRADIESQVFRVLRCIARRRDRQKIIYPVPDRVSSRLLANVVEVFLAEPSGGLRPLIVVTALMKTLGSTFSLFTRVESQGLNEADTARNRPGDVMCYGPATEDENSGSDEELRLVVEVKDTTITLQQTEHSLSKVNASRETTHDLLFASPGIAEVDASAIGGRLDRAWRQGLDVKRVDVLTLVRATTVLLRNAERIEFLREIGEELNQRSEHVHRDAWRRLLEEAE